MKVLAAFEAEPRHVGIYVLGPVVLDAPTTSLSIAATRGASDSIDTIASVTLQVRDGDGWRVIGSESLKGGSAVQESVFTWQESVAVGIEVRAILKVVSTMTASLELRAGDA